MFGSKTRSALLSAPQPTKASGDLSPCTLLIIFIVWVLVAGYATATECAASGVPGSLAIAVLTLVYRVLGIALDGSSTIVLTSAVVLPMIQKAGFELIWFSILIVLLVEIAEVTPPVGFDLFVLQ